MTRATMRLAAMTALIYAMSAASVAPVTAQANPQYTQWGSVQDLEAGWGQDTMSIRHSAALMNPGSCSVTNAGYATNPADTGHSLFHTLLLSAFLNRKEVSLLVDGCVFNKPRVIAVKIR
jgi:hypothetical protein